MTSAGVAAVVDERSAAAYGGYGAVGRMLAEFDKRGEVVMMDGGGRRCGGRRGGGGGVGCASDQKRGDERRGA